MCFRPLTGKLVLIHWSAPDVIYAECVEVSVPLRGSWF